MPTQVPQDNGYCRFSNQIIILRIFVSSGVPYECL